MEVSHAVNTRGAFRLLHVNHTGKFGFVQTILTDPHYIRENPSCCNYFV